jgi:hypothetical protein
MTVKLRLTGEPDELARVLHALDQVLEVATDRRTYPQRGGFGVRCYAEVRLPATTSTTRTDRPRPMRPIANHRDDTNGD